MHERGHANPFDVDEGLKARVFKGGEGRCGDGSGTSEGTRDKRRRQQRYEGTTEGDHGGEGLNGFGKRTIAIDREQRMDHSHARLLLSLLVLGILNGLNICFSA